MLRTALDISLLEVLYPGDTESALIDETAYTQPALFAVEYALAQLWRSWGIEPSAMMGHSVGEYVAACVAGVLSLEDGLKIVAERGRLMQALPRNGDMAAVFADAACVAAALQPYADQVAIASVNGPQAIVISGERQAVRAVSAALHEDGIQTKALTVSHAFHSPLVEPMLESFEQVVRACPLATPMMSLVSNVNGKVAREELTNASYWVSHVRQPVQFAVGMNTLSQQGCDVFLEIGPQPTLIGMGRKCLPDGTGAWLPSLRRGQSDWQQMFQSLGALYVRGATIDWAGVDREYVRRRLQLPSYPFQRQRYWIEASAADESVMLQTRNRSRAGALSPLLGEPLHSAALQNHEKQFEVQVSSDTPAFLRDHRIFDTVIFPGTGYIEMALAAGAAVFKSDDVVIEDVVIQQALGLTEHTQQIMQCVLTPKAFERYTFQIFSFHMDDELSEPVWTLHATGVIRRAESNDDQSPVDLLALQVEITETLSIEIAYEQFRAQSIHYGPSFRAIKGLWKRDHSVLGQIQLPETLSIDSRNYQLHPVLLDACGQTIGAAFPSDDPTMTYVPVGFEQLQVYRLGESELWSHAVIRPTENSTDMLQVADLHLYDRSGALVARVEGWTMRRAERETMMLGLRNDRVGDWLYEIAWQPQELSEPTRLSSVEEEPSHWLIFADTKGFGCALAQQLQASGDHCVLVTVGQAYECQINDPSNLAGRHYQLNPTTPEDFQQLFQSCSEETDLPYRGIIHAWSLDRAGSTDTDLTTIYEAQQLGCGSVLHLIQALSKAGCPSPPRLWLVTQGAQGMEIDPVEVRQSTLWGLGRVITLEHPELRCTRVDISPAGTQDDVQMLFAELTADAAEDQLLYRHSVRHVGRLVKHIVSPADETGERPHQLRLSSYGVLENLTLVPMTRRQPGPREVEIQVRASGLNFRDVLNALGMLTDVAEQLGIASAADMRFGFECAGIVVAVGGGVTDIQVGDAVIASQTTESLGRFVIVDAAFVVSKPEHLSFVEATTIPLAFLTAYHGLHSCARIQAGDRVLIHAAAGGVGQAAVQLAQQAGAEVFATASPGKWDVLKSMGVHHVMNSRTLDFADSIMKATEGEGVNIVLNSLNGDFISKNLEVLGQEGRFVEIGKIGIWDEQQVRTARPDISYFPFDLGDIARQEPGVIKTMFRTIADAFRDRRLHPMPYTTFPFKEAVDAFRYMAQAQHIGKIVITQPVEGRESMYPDGKSIDESHSYLITGGLGALGLQVARWLVGKGARYLTLIGRRGVDQAAQETLNELEQSGAAVRVLKADVSQEDDVARIFETVQNDMPPLRGIVHAAGVLNDGILLQQNWERFLQVMAPKVAGTWHLHKLTQDMPLDFFICFSSGASLLGSAGQGNYAAANAFMDGLMAQRRAQGLPGLSINWGPWAEVGMAAELGSNERQRLAEQGWESMSPEQGLNALDLVWQLAPSQVAVLPINWSRFAQQFRMGDPPPVLVEWVSTTEPGRREVYLEAPLENLLERLQAAPPNEHLKLVLGHLQDRISKVLGLASSQRPDVNQTLQELGFDSLMHMELRGYIMMELEVNIPMEKFSTHLNIGSLSHFLLEQLTLNRITLLGQTSTDSSDDMEELTL